MGFTAVDNKKIGIEFAIELIQLNIDAVDITQTHEGAMNRLNLI